MNTLFTSADILLPDFKKVNGNRWAVIACDQYTSNQGYWDAVSETVGDAPSALNLVLPEIYLSEAEKKIPAIRREMQKILPTLKEYPDSYIYLERTQADGRVRRGIVGKIDLEAYDYHKGSKSLIRPTEATVEERIPPRLAIRRGADLELPHVMLLINDKEDVFFNALEKEKGKYPKIYDFELMQGGGSVVGYALKALPLQLPLEEELSLAVGDGNHSLATAKAYYEELKAELGEAAKKHPARYALVEVVNLYDKALDFEPIYRVLFNADFEGVVSFLEKKFEGMNGKEPAQQITLSQGELSVSLAIPHPEHPLPIGNLQPALDEYLSLHPKTKIDYIHDLDEVLDHAKNGAVGITFRGMEKTDLFPAVRRGGALPRKTFSMGHSVDKRYYIEARKIK